MGAKPCICVSKNDPSKSVETLPPYDKRNVSTGKKVSRLSAISQHISFMKLKTLIQQSDKQYLSPSILFILIDLESQLNLTSKAMLHILKSYMGSQLVMVQDVKQIPKDQLNERSRIFLFTNAEYADSLGKTLNVAEKIFVLGASTNPVCKTLENIQDLIFQVAEEFAQCYKEAPEQCKRLDESPLADDKHQTISEMYRHLMDVPTEEIPIKASICTDTSVLWLSSDRDIKNEEKLTQIMPSLIVFGNEKTCLEHVAQCGIDTAIFFIIDPNFESSTVAHLERLAQVKYMYYTERFNDINKLCFQLTHDLIKHYGHLGDQLKAEERNQEAQKMFLRAQQLCQILFK